MHNNNNSHYVNNIPTSK